ncbi:hypothetical protein [Shewanella algae]|uniref:hypothetical protein n=1 Tax=Shewanella algae TaxID=38313 RepID=UPI001BEEB52F|nr:hypothetical protein [Shewanella algae]BCV50691.1 hypothetical protein TUM17382_33840 [Shewanella algae]
MKAELLRDETTVNQPDPRWLHYTVTDENGVSRGLTFEDFIAPIKDIQLSKKVPKDVVVHFETAKNLAAYSWYVYRFIPVSKLHAYTSVEFALRLKTGNKKKPFSKLLKQAANEGWFKNENFSQWQQVTERNQQNFIEEKEVAEFLNQEPPEEPQYWDYVNVITDSIPYFRNEFAHGSISIFPDRCSSLVVASELINQIFEA